jgi:hypothetical protein
VLPTPTSSTATTTMMMMYAIISAHCLQELHVPDAARAPSARVQSP